MSRLVATSVVDDALTVLDLLCKRWGDGSTRELNLWSSKGPYVQVEYHHDFADSDRRVFPVTDRVVQELVQLGYVSGTPAWGYTDKRRLRITDLGASELDAVRSRVDMDWRVNAHQWLLNGEW